MKVAGSWGRVRQVSARIQQVDAWIRSQQTNAGTKTTNNQWIDNLQVCVSIDRFATDTNNLL